MMTWDEAVEWYRQQPGNEQAIRWNYFDDDALEAARRFASGEEFAATLALMPAGANRVLDVGAGTGMASYAFAKKGFHVTALEPDASPRVGAEAIRMLAARGGVEISILETGAETLGLPDESIDFLYARQVLHHVPDLASLGREAARVLRPGGRMLATREHVLRRAEDLPSFLAAHPLHRYYGGENALVLEGYLAPMRAAGLEVAQVLGPFDSPINYYPLTKEQVLDQACWALADRWGWQGKRRDLWGLVRPVAKSLAADRLLRWHAATHYQPGNLYSFLFVKSGASRST